MLPKDCGKDKEGDYSDCKNNGRDPVVGHGGGDRARSEYYTSEKFRGEKWQPESVIVEAKASGLPLTYELRKMNIPVEFSYY